MLLKLYVAVIALTAAATVVSGHGIIATYSTVPQVPTTDETTAIDIAITDADYGQPIQWGTIETTHGRKVHVLVVSDDRNYISHLHPQDFNYTITETTDVFRVEYDFPVAGKWWFGIDITFNQTKQYGMITSQPGPFETAHSFFSIDVEGSVTQDPYAPPMMPVFEQWTRPVPHAGDDTYTAPIYLPAQETEPMANGSFMSTLMPMVVDESSMSMRSMNMGPIYVGDCLALHFMYMDDMMNPVNYLTPYLEAAMHLAVVGTTTRFEHNHGMESDMTMSSSSSMMMNMSHTCGDHHMMPGGMMMPPEQFGPGIVVMHKFMVPDDYTAFAQVDINHTALHFSRFDFKVVMPPDPTETSSMSSSLVAIDKIDSAARSLYASAALLATAVAGVVAVLAF